MVEYTYYLFNAAVIIPVLLLSIFFDVKTHKQWKRLLNGYIFVSVPFIIWDIWAASAGHWLFSERFITTFRVGTIPLEEIAFFITVPFAIAYTYEVVCKYTKKEKIGNAILGIPFVVFLGSLLLLLLNTDKAYTVSASIACLVTVLFLVKSQLVFLRTFWITQAVVLAQFLIANTILTALPIISYGENAITGFRIGTIPIEDFFFHFALTTMFLMVYLWFTLLFRKVEHPILHRR